jgi:hypothetical protein
MRSGSGRNGGLVRGAVRPVRVVEILVLAQHHHQEQPGQADGRCPAARLVGEHGVIDGTGVVVVMLVQQGTSQAASPARRIVVMLAVTGFAVPVLVVVAGLVLTMLVVAVVVAGCLAAGCHDSGTRPAARGDSTGTVADQRSSTLPTRQ